MEKFTVAYGLCTFIYVYKLTNFHLISYLAKAVDWGTSVDPIKCYIGAVGAEIEETCNSGTCEKTGSMYQ